MRRARTVSLPVHKPIQVFIKAESSGGIILVAATLFALIWANSGSAAGYYALWREAFGVTLGPRSFSMSVHHWVNDGLMAVFFFWVGLEIKREILTGELASRRRAALPIMGALGGMLIPAAIYVALNGDGEGSRGWGIPMATDIAFAIGILMLLGKRVPLGLKVFLTALAVVDDLGAVVVIAVFYTADLSPVYLAGAFAVLSAMLLLARSGIRARQPFVLGGILVWMFFLRSGVHATVAGVLSAMTVPHRVEGGGESSLENWERELAPWVTWTIMPIFALANAGVTLNGAGLAQALGSPVPLGILLGLVVGKQLGIFGFAWIAVKLGWAGLPTRATWRKLHGVAILGGIGFTMSIFIANLAFPEALSHPAGSGSEDPVLSGAKLGILMGSLVSAVLGTVVLLARTGREPDGEET